MLSWVFGVHYGEQLHPLKEMEELLESIHGWENQSNLGKKESSWRFIRWDLFLMIWRHSPTSLSSWQHILTLFFFIELKYLEEEVGSMMKGLQSNSDPAKTFSMYRWTSMFGLPETSSSPRGALTSRHWPNQQQSGDALQESGRRVRLTPPSPGTWGWLDVSSLSRSGQSCWHCQRLGDDHSSCCGLGHGPGLFVWEDDDATGSCTLEVVEVEDVDNVGDGLLWSRASPSSLSSSPPVSPACSWTCVLRALASTWPCPDPGNFFPHFPDVSRCCPPLWSSWSYSDPLICSQCRHFQRASILAEPSLYVVVRQPL